MFPHLREGKVWTHWGSPELGYLRPLLPQKG